MSILRPVIAISAILFGSTGCDPGTEPVELLDETRAPGFSTGSQSIRPEKATLEVGGRKLPARLLATAARVVATWRDERLTLEGSVVRLMSHDGATVIWSATDAGDRELHFGGRVGGTGYFIAVERDEYGRLRLHDASHHVLPLDLEGGRWLEPLRLPAEDLLGPPILEVRDDRFAVMTFRGETAESEPWMTGYDVACYRETALEPTWNRGFRVTRTRRNGGVHVLGIPSPSQALSGARPLTWMGERLVVCAEALQPILALDADTGTTLWDVARLWEFDRGFIGPSVFSYFISRFGKDEDADRPENEEELPEPGEEPPPLRDPKAEFELIHRGAVIGGPAVVPLGFRRDDDTHSVFVAVSLEKTIDAFPAHLARCRIYEIDDGGRPISLLDLPYVLDGESFRVVDGGVVWSGNDGYLLKLLPSRTRPVITMGGGGSDGLTPLDWLRRLPSRQLDGWLRAGPSGIPPSIGADIALYQVAGGTILAPRDSIYRFPLEAVDLRSGAVRHLVLDVPFEGSIEIPTTSFSNSAGFQTRTPHRLAVTSIEVDQDRLRLTLSFEESAAVIEFQLDRAALFSAASRSSSTSAPSVLCSRVVFTSLDELTVRGVHAVVGDLMSGLPMFCPCQRLSGGQNGRNGRPA